MCGGNLKKRLRTMGYQSLRLEVVLSLGLFLALTAAQQHPTVTVPEQGVVVGTTEIFQESEFLNEDKTIDVFKGIPFAEAPVDSLRFKPPKPKLPWEGTYNATYFRDGCMQAASSSGLFPPLPTMSEDCLQLNIYAPRPQVKGGAAVMVRIHGGAFLAGSAIINLHNGVSLVALGDVIVVSINYRLNVFGFLTTGDDAAPGNVGLLDQVLALKWIKQNIAAFGGDSDRITIFGESAGSASVSLLVLSKAAQGLFSNAIMESGTAFSPWAFSADKDRHRQQAFDIGEKLGCTTTDSTALIDCLRDKDATVLFNAVPQTSLQLIIPLVVVDGTFLDDTPANLYAKGRYNHATILLGSNKDEGRLFTNVASMDVPLIRREIFDTSLSEEVDNFFGGVNDLLEDSIKQQYVDWSQADKNDANYFWSYVDYITDFFFACGNDQVARYHVQGGDDVFMYQMTRGNPKFGELTLPTWLGATHGVEMWFVFGFPFIPEYQPLFANRLSDDKALSVKIMEFWTSFAKNGTPEASSESDMVVWPKFTVPELEYLELDVNLTTRRALKSEECHFWNVILDKLKTLPGQNCASDLWRETSKGRYSCAIEQDVCDTLDCKDNTPRCGATGLLALKVLTAAVAFMSLILTKQ